MSDQQLEKFAQLRGAKAGIILTRMIEQEWERVLTELSALDIDVENAVPAAILIGQYQILDKLMAILSEGSLSSDYEIEAQWRSKLIEHIVEGFGLEILTIQPPMRYQSLAQQVAAACGLEVIED